MGEMEYIPYLIQALTVQSFKNFRLIACVNQPESWWTNLDKRYVCKNNQETINYLRECINIDNVEIIDRSSKGTGWDPKNHGVGWARKTIMDEINLHADDNDIIVSLDGDTTFGQNYLKSIIDNFNQHPFAIGMSVPYYHPLSIDLQANRAMLRYEIYMRNYSLNMWRIRSPYSFTALGSAIALPVWAYRKIGGMSPKKSGEDFYFLQKLRKAGDIICWNIEKVFPGTRFSDRVFFGTGPAMIKGNNGDWSSYPVYHYKLFDQVKETYDMYNALFDNSIQTPLDDFLNEVFKADNIWKPLIINASDINHFIKAAHQKFDGFRILQYVKMKQRELDLSDEDCLRQYIFKFYEGELTEDLFDRLSRLSFEASSLEDLNKIRNFLIWAEEKFLRINIFANPWS